MIPKIRTVKPELFSHEGLFEAEVDCQLPLRLAFIALFTCCDREGRFRWQPRRLKRDLLPYDNLDLSSVLEALATRGFIKKYEHESECYGCIPSWSKHQYINNHETKSLIPPLERVTEALLKNPNTDNRLKIESASENDACLTTESRVPDDVARACTSMHGSGTSMHVGKGKEGNGREHGREGKGSFVESGATRPRAVKYPIQKIFEHWQHVMHHPNANLDHKRKAIIEKALAFGYTAEQLCNAITGCSYTPHNVGDNDRGQRFDGLQLILRDGDQIDRFIHNCEYPPHPISDADRRSQSNVETLEGWMARTIEEAADANL